MRTRNAKLVVVAVAVILGIGGLAAYRSDEHADTSISQRLPQCAHWSILRCCQLQGVPMGMGTLLKRLPRDDNGHSLYQVNALLEDIGFQTETLRCDYQTLLSRALPCIAHLENPDHYVVVSGVDDDYIHVFDGDGIRTARDKRRFLKRWSGIALFPSVPGGNVRLPKYLPIAQKAPRIRFRQLLVDPGSVPANGKPFVFEYPFENVGTQPLIIEEVDPDCSCIKFVKPDSAIPPGGSGVIRLSYEVEAKRGAFSHRVLVKTNDPQIRLFELVASGWTGVEFKVNPQAALLKDPVNGQPVTARFFVRYTGDQEDLDVALEDLVVENASVADHAFGPMTDAHAERLFPGLGDVQGSYQKCYVLEITVVPSGTPGTVVKGTAKLATNVEGYEAFDLEMGGRIRESVDVHPDVIDFSPVDGEEIKERSVVLRSNTAEPFRIIGIRLPEQYLDCEYDTNRLATEFEVSISKETRPGDKVGAADKKEVIVCVQLDSGKQLEFPVKVLDQ